jgi:hypothetical protein
MARESEWVFREIAAFRMLFRGLAKFCKEFSDSSDGLLDISFFGS